MVARSVRDAEVPGSSPGTPTREAREVNVDWSADLAIATEGATARLAANINQRRQRVFGVLKTQNEFVGVVGPERFEIWERQKRAIHARGRARGRQRGTRLEVAFVVPFRTRALLGAFAVLYVLVAIGIASRPPDPGLSAEEAAIAVFGAIALAVIFSAGARSQRSDLRAFLERTFADVPRI